jgi:hypothetical protein
MNISKSGSHSKKAKEDSGRSPSTLIHDLIKPVTQTEKRRTDLGEQVI